MPLGGRPFLSVVIPAYNAASYIERCLSSLRPLGKASCEILLVDDGSQDATLVLAEAGLASFPRHRLFRTSNNGPGAARNLGLRESQGRYVLFVDSDDWVIADVLLRILQVLEATSPDLLTADYLQCVEWNEGKVERVFRGLLTGEKYAEATTEKLRSCLFYRRYKPLVWAYVYKRSFLVENNLFFLEKTYFEDEEWIPRVISIASSISFFPEPWYVYRRRRGSITTENSLKKVEDKIYIASKIAAESEKAAPALRTFYRYTAQRIFLSARRDLLSLPEDVPHRDALVERARIAWNWKIYWKEKICKMLKQFLI